MATIAKNRVLNRILKPLSDSLNEESAQNLTRLKADPIVQKRVNDLSRKCNNSELSSTERDEYHINVTAGEMIAILQAHARLRTSRRKSS